MNFLKFLVGSGASSTKDIQTQKQGEEAFPVVSQSHLACHIPAADPEEPVDVAATDSQPSSEDADEASAAEGENLDLQSEDGAEQGVASLDGAAQEEGVEEVTSDDRGSDPPGEASEGVISSTVGPSGKVLLPETPVGCEGSEDCWDGSSALQAFLADSLWDESSVDFGNGGESSSVEGDCPEALGEDGAVASLASSHRSSELWKWLQEDLSSELRKEEEEQLTAQGTEMMPLDPAASVEGTSARTEETPATRALASAPWKRAREDQRRTDQRHAERLLESVEGLLWGGGTLQDLNRLLRATHEVTGLSWKKINRACRRLGLGLVSHVFHRYDLRRELLWHQELRVPMAYLRTPELREVRRAFCVKLL